MMTTYRRFHRTRDDVWYAGLSRFATDDPPASAPAMTALARAFGDPLIAWMCVDAAGVDPLPIGAIVIEAPDAHPPPLEAKLRLERMRAALIDPGIDPLVRDILKVLVGG